MPETPKLTKRHLAGRYQGRRPAEAPRARGWQARVASLLSAVLKPAGLHVGTLDDRRLMEVADQYGYYWYNAGKKLDIRLDAEFGPLATAILDERQTYLGYDRLYTLWQGVQAVTSPKFNVAEVGTYKGGSAKFIAEALQRKGRDNRFYVCDTFEGHASVDLAVDGKHEIGKQFRTTSAKRVARYLKAFKNVRILAGDIVNTATQIPAGAKFGFVHIDVDVYPPTRFCLDFFGARLVHGGIMVVDDYGALTCQGVHKAVEEFAEANPDFRRFHLMSGQAILVRAAS